MPTQRPAHLDYTPAPDPDARTDEVHTPFRLSVNLSTHSASGPSRWTLPTPHTHFRRCSVALRSSEKCSPTSGVSEATLTDNAEFPTLLCPCTSITHSLVITEHRQRLSSLLDLKNLRNERAVQSRRSKSTNGFLTSTTAILPRNRWGGLHIPQGCKGRRAKRSAGRWGVLIDTSGASPRTPELPHFSVVSNFSP